MYNNVGMVCAIHGVKGHHYYIAVSKTALKTVLEDFLASRRLANFIQLAQPQNGIHSSSYMRLLAVPTYGNYMH